MTSQQQMGKRRVKSPRKVGYPRRVPVAHQTPHSDRDADGSICIEELSEEDLQLKTDLEMLVERLKVWLAKLFVSRG